MDPVRMVTIEIGGEANYTQKLQDISRELDELLHEEYLQEEQPEVPPSIESNTA